MFVSLQKSGQFERLEPKIIGLKERNCCTGKEFWGSTVSKWHCLLGQNDCVYKNSFFAFLGETNTTKTPVHLFWSTLNCVKSSLHVVKVRVELSVRSYKLQSGLIKYTESWKEENHRREVGFTVIFAFLNSFTNIFTLRQ